MKHNRFRIFAVWAGDNPIPAERWACWQTFGKTGLYPILITPDTLREWVVSDHPLHPAYRYLSATHRADYLRAYLMHHHGGGYSDIKAQTGPWNRQVERVLRSSLIGCGYREVRGGSPAIHRHLIDGRAHILSREVPQRLADVASLMLRATYPLRIGNCAFWFKPGTAYTRRWLACVEARLDRLLPALARYPAAGSRDRQGSGSGYPVPWTFLLGDITGPLSLLASPRIARTLPAPRFSDYGAEMPAAICISES